MPRRVVDLALGSGGRRHDSRVEFPARLQQRQRLLDRAQRQVDIQPALLRYAHPFAILPFRQPRRLGQVLAASRTELRWIGLRNSAILRHRGCIHIYRLAP
jgi:hypothetical protein